MQLDDIFSLQLTSQIIFIQVTTTGFEHATTYFVNENLNIHPNWFNLRK